MIRRTSGNWPMFPSSRGFIAFLSTHEPTASMRPRSRRVADPHRRCSSSKPLATSALLALCAVLLGPASTWAYRPFVSTDAAVADPKEVEIELGYFNLERRGHENTI